MDENEEIVGKISKDNENKVPVTSILNRTTNEDLDVIINKPWEISREIGSEI